jgi:hypothetical protein
MSSRNMCLLPRATLHSDSEQSIPSASNFRTMRFHTSLSYSQKENQKNYNQYVVYCIVDRGGVLKIVLSK